MLYAKIEEDGKSIMAAISAMRMEAREDRTFVIDRLAAAEAKAIYHFNEIKDAIEGAAMGAMT